MLYFAYGSNLDVDRIKERCPSAEIVGKAVLNDFKLLFQENNSGNVVANIKVNKGSVVEGVVFHINYKEIVNLDKAEGHPYVYARHEVDVKIGKKVVEVWTYWMPQTITKIKWGKGGKIDFKGCTEVARRYGVPNKEYLAHIEKGYNYFKLPLYKLYRCVSVCGLKKDA